MKKLFLLLFLLLFVLSLLIVNANAYEDDLFIKQIRDVEFTAEETQNNLKQLSKYGVISLPIMNYYGNNIKCVDGDTIHIHNGAFDELKDDGLIFDAATYSFRIAGVDTFDSKSKKMIEKQKKATGLSEIEIKKRAQQAKEYCEEYFIEKKNCNKFSIHGTDPYGRFVVIPCFGGYQRNLVDKGLATIYKGNDLYKLIFDKDY